MLIGVSIVAFIVVVAVVDIAALTVAGRADNQMDIERPDLIDIDKRS